MIGFCARLGVGLAAGFAAFMAALVVIGLVVGALGVGTIVVMGRYERWQDESRIARCTASVKCLTRAIADAEANGDREAAEVMRGDLRAAQAKAAR